MLTKSENTYYARQLLLPQLGKKGQLLLKSAKVLVIGAGGLGSPVLQYLAGAGIGTIGIIDGDLISETNIHRQILYPYDTIGQLKAIVAARQLAQNNPHISLKTHTEFFTQKNAKNILEQYDIAVDCTDNFTARYLLNDTALLVNKPWVYGSIQEFKGQLAVFNYKGGATYRCLYPEPPKENYKASDFGVLGVLPGVVGCLQTNEVIKCICEIGEVLSGKILTVDLLSSNYQLFSFERSTTE